MKKYFAWFVGTCPYFLFFSMLLSMFFFYANYVCLLALVIFLMLCPVSIASAYLFVKRVNVSCDVDLKRVEKNQSFVVKITAENFSFAVVGNFKVNVVMKHSGAGKAYYQEISMPVPVHGKEEISVEISSPFCGNVWVGIENIEVTSIFNFVTLPKDVIAGKQVLIMPEIVRLEIPLTMEKRRGENFELLQKGNDTTEILGVREYVVGDLWQNIHWKLSAKKEELFVKEYSAPEGTAPTVLLEFPHSNSFATMENVLELYLAVVQSLQCCQACFIENGEFVEVMVTSSEQYEELLGRVLTLEEEQSRVLDYLQREGNFDVLYVCTKEVLQGQDTIFAKKGEAVAVWL